MDFFPVSQGLHMPPRRCFPTAHHAASSPLIIPPAAAGLGRGRSSLSSHASRAPCSTRDAPSSAGIMVHDDLKNITGHNAQIKHEQCTHIVTYTAFKEENAEKPSFI